jgi:hypothetical protein
MRNLKAPGKLLTFPEPTLAPESLEHWIDQILNTKDHLVDAIEFLRTAYNEMLAGSPVRELDEVLAQVDAILKSDKTMGKYTVVGVIRTRGSKPAKPPQSSLLLFASHRKRLLTLDGSGARAFSLPVHTEQPLPTRLFPKKSRT